MAESSNEKAHKVLERLQAELKVPKDLWNSYSEYNYRSAELIIEKVKPMLREHEAVIILSDSLEEAGGRAFVKASAVLSVRGEKEVIGAQHSVEIPTTRKGMDTGQLAGACSSYARKYALCGLLLIDEGVDNDSLPPEGTEFVCPADIESITKEGEELGVDWEKFFDHFGVKKVEELLTAQVDEVRDLLDAKRRNSEKPSSNG